MNALASILAAQKESGSLLGLLFPLLLLGPLVYMMVVPQRKQKQKHAKFVAGLALGDDVVTSGGIHGSITFLEDTVAHVQVDTDVVIRVSKASLARLEAGEQSTDESNADDASADAS